ncbi:class I SAM-dependent methyltransferase [Dyella tabacisoli]|nr:class I SAM-dependent methyltransferase [Dyella tabacisoli]
MTNVEIYYDTQYDILVGSEEEDQIYEVRDGKPIYRTDHQVNTLLEKLGFEQDVDLLDYGCAKSSTIQALCATPAKVRPHLFDVSKRYIPFWEKFVDSNNWAVNQTKPEWAAQFDVVTSFFSLEHIPTVLETMCDIAGLLKPGGVFYGIVPNVLSNIADFIVVDHCNHFTPTSLKQLLANAGLELQEIDERTHRGAFVIVARKPFSITAITPNISRSDIEHTCTELSLLADFWRGAAARVRAYETDLTDDDKVVIYGAGFYGAFISASLAHPDRVICHLDQNPYLQGKEFNARPILAPDKLPADINTVLVGLNPAHAKAIISDIPALAHRKLDYFYL